MQPMRLPFFTLFLLISFAAVNAMLFTPALPNLTRFFDISEMAAQSTITWFLVGYTVGQLLYGPIANRFGRKSALYVGIRFCRITKCYVHEWGFLIPAPGHCYGWVRLKCVKIE
jgi:MFS family permease